MRALIAIALLVCCWAKTADAEVLKIGILKFGTVSWEMDVVKRHGLDQAEGLAIELVELASNEATKVALQAKAVDVIASDWLWVSRQRHEGMAVTFAPFSTSIGALMVAETSPARSVKDLKGKRIGVAGGPLDKSWLMLLAQARQDYGIDLAREAQPIYGAPPLLAEKLAQGELDAALLFWNFSAELEVQGFRRLATMEDVELALGATAPVSMVGYVFYDDFARSRPQAVEGFLKASARAKAILRESDAEWERLKPLMRAENDAVSERLRTRFRDGIPTRGTDDEQADAARLYDAMVKIAGYKLVGGASSLSDGTFFRGLRP